MMYAHKYTFISFALSCFSLQASYVLFEKCPEFLVKWKWNFLWNFGSEVPWKSKVKSNRIIRLKFLEYFDKFSDHRFALIKQIRVTERLFDTFLETISNNYVVFVWNSMLFLCVRTIFTVCLKGCTKRAHSHPKPW